MPIESLSALIKLTRTQMGYTQVQLAAQAGISLQALQVLESGQGNPSLNLIHQVTAVLGLRCEWHAPHTDWNLLATLGVPLFEQEPPKQKNIVFKQQQLAIHLRLALLELKTCTQRQQEALQATLWVLKHNHTAWYKKNFAKNSTAQALTLLDYSGRMIKLARIARARVAEYL